MRHFGIIEIAGGGPDVPFIVSKIAILYRINGTIIPHPPPPAPSNDEGAKEQKCAILASLEWGEGWSRCFIYFVQDRNLGQNKMEQLSPIPPPPKQ